MCAPPLRPPRVAQDLRRFLLWAADHLGYAELRAVHGAEPTAELEPLREGEPPQVGKEGVACVSNSTCCSEP
jgi:hypothetical protein